MSENSDMTCAELADVAAELALGVLTGRERAMAVAHLDNCDTCRNPRGPGGSPGATRRRG
jgi:hypothetical protein